MPPRLNMTAVNWARVLVCVAAACCLSGVFIGETFGIKYLATGIFSDLRPYFEEASMHHSLRLTYVIGGYFFMSLWTTCWTSFLIFQLIIYRGEESGQGDAKCIFLRPFNRAGIFFVYVAIVCIVLTHALATASLIATLAWTRMFWNDDAHVELSRDAHQLTFAIVLLLVLNDAGQCVSVIYWYNRRREHFARSENQDLHDQVAAPAQSRNTSFAESVIELSTMEPAYTHQPNSPI